MDFLALAQALERGRVSGDNSEAAALFAQLETEELPAEPGEGRRFRIRGTPAEHYSVDYAPADTAPRTFPSELPWLPAARVAVTHMGGPGLFAAVWHGVDGAVAFDRILQHSTGQGWVASGTQPTPQAPATRVQVLQRAAFVRHVIATALGRKGTVQVLQMSREVPDGEPAGSAG